MMESYTVSKHIFEGLSIRFIDVERHTLTAGTDANGGTPPLNKKEKGN